MTITRRSPRVLAAAAIVLAMLSAPATAGAPKSLRVSDISITRHHDVRVTLLAPGTKSTALLAQVTVDRRVRLGKGCRARSGERLVADVALELGLDRSVRSASEPQTKDRAAYVFQANGRDDSPRRSLNMLLARRGIARVTGARGTLRKAFLAAQRSARRGHHGRWACLRHRS